VLYENREENWRSQLEDKNSEIMDLRKRLAVSMNISRDESKRVLTALV